MVDKLPLNNGYVPCWHIWHDGRRIKGLCKRQMDGIYHVVMFYDDLPEDLRKGMNKINVDGGDNYVHGFVKAHQLIFPPRVPSATPPPAPTPATEAGELPAGGSSVVYETTTTLDDIASGFELGKRHTLKEALALEEESHRKLLERFAAKQQADADYWNNLDGTNEIAALRDQLATVTRERDDLIKLVMDTVEAAGYRALNEGASYELRDRLRAAIGNHKQIPSGTLK